MLKTIGRVIGFVLLGANSFGQNYLQFIENKGQWDPNIRYQGEIATGAFALQKTGYRVVLQNKYDLEQLTAAIHSHKSITEGQEIKHTNARSGSGENLPLPADGAAGYVPGVVRAHAYEMRFLNSNTNPLIIPDKPLAAYNNYFIGNDSSKWGSNCRIFQAITYKNVYPNIDIRYYTASGVLKYDFILHPGADVNRIAMYFDGVESLKTSKGELHVKTSVDEVIEQAPYTYQLINNKRVEIPCRFEVKGNIVQFKLDGEYSRDAILVIDPSLVFSTFSGSTADNWGYTATYDGKGNFYAGGIVLTPGNGSRFPISNGAFQ